MASVNCRERGATMIFSLRLLLDSDISVACSLRDRLPGIVTQGVSDPCAGVEQKSLKFLDYLALAARNPATPLASTDLSSSRCHKVA